MKIGFIGGGNMAAAIIRGITLQSMSNIIVSEPRDVRRQYLQQHFGIETTDSNTKVVTSSEIIILAVKPQDIDAVLKEIGGTVTERKTVVSVAAGITLSYLSSKLNTSRLIRVMPNTPALVQEGVTVMSMCECFSDKEISTVKEIFMSLGHLLVLPEKHMDTVTAISGSGPAFFALFIESMIESGINNGLSEADSIVLAVQTAIGTCQLISSGMSPASVREMVTSPGGTTAAGLEVFEKRKLKEIVAEAVSAAKNRSGALGSKGG